MNYLADIQDDPFDFPEPKKQGLPNRVSEIEGKTVFVPDLQGKPIPERRWVVDGWILSDCVTALYGDGGVGKSLPGFQTLRNRQSSAQHIIQERLAAIMIKSVGSAVRKGHLLDLVDQRLITLGFLIDK